MSGRELPASAYTSDAFMQLERRTLFGGGWHAIGFAHDVANCGDIHPVMSAAGRALLLVRGREGEIRVFYNYCRHRGMQLIPAATHGRSNIVCPYHAWCYDLDGTLIRVPHRYGFGRHHERPVDLPGLESVRIAQWAGLVFADLSGKAPAFESYIAPLAERWAHFDLERLVPGTGMTFEVAGNWKLAVENFIDIYHVPYVHPALNQYNNMADHYFIQEGTVVVGEGNHAFIPTDEGAGKLPRFANLTPEQDATIEAISLFPNLLLTTFNDNFRVILLEPTGPGSCRERVEIFFVGEEALVAELEPYRRAVVDRFPVFNREDVAIVERLQQSFETAAFEGANFNPFFDANVAHFQHMVAQACEED